MPNIRSEPSLTVPNKNSKKKTEVHVNVGSVHLQRAHLPLQHILNNTGECCYSCVKLWADLRKTRRVFEDDRALFVIYLFPEVRVFSLQP